LTVQTREQSGVGALDSQRNEIFSFSYGTAAGEYYGARSNANGDIEIMRNNITTGGNSWYYSVNEDLTAGGIVVQAGKFDPRTRAWYKAAVEAGGPIYSPLYKHFVMDDLAVSAAWPVYNEAGGLQGVLGTHMLLSDIGSYLKDAVEEYHGAAFIIEKGSDNLIANSIGAANFSALADGRLERYTLEDIKSTDINNAYKQSLAISSPRLIYEGENDNYFLNTRELRMDGIDWIIVSAIPESPFMKDAIYGMRRAVLIATLAILLSTGIYFLFTTKHLKPIKSLLQVSDELSAGNLSIRVDIIRNDEIGQISKSFNTVADKMQALISNLETVVQERTEELRAANSTLADSKDELRLILDSAAEAIYGIDLDGNCTFCNRSCIEMLGYSDQTELLGKNMHRKIHYACRDGTSLPDEDCGILRAFIQGEGSHADNEVFWRADGTSFDVEYFSYPQIKNGEISGAVITFMDISKRKKEEAEIYYLNCYDSLTGLHNRRCFEENRGKIDIPDNLPLSVIFADINGLKMTNDIFGHTAGDELIKKSSEILQEACRQNDVIARTGGDEFIILLPVTTRENAEKILARIKSRFADAHVEAIKCSIAIGLDTKYEPEQLLDEVMANAENAMYKDKAMNRKAYNQDIINTIIETLHAKSPIEKQHSICVSELCADVGIALQLPENEISKLKRAGYLHDIGKITLADEILVKDNYLDQEIEKMHQHSVVGYRILSLFDDTLDLAEYVYGHHERWDGTGYPRGLKGEQIPLLSRIISVAETYDRVLNRGRHSLATRKTAALDVIKHGAGSQFDAEIAKLFVQIIAKNEGGFCA
jgi:diguanylate cyclase (GGDEF)-like protein/PAS domain S-box-containing protein